jgi:hypothetical protein
MVIGADRRASLACAALAVWPLAAAEKAEPMLMKLDPANRAKVLMALLALVLVGLGLIALAWIGGRRLRRVIKQPLRPVHRSEDQWYRKPLVPQEKDEGGRMKDE